MVISTIKKNKVETRNDRVLKWKVTNLNKRYHEMPSWEGDNQTIILEQVNEGSSRPEKPMQRLCLKQKYKQ